MQLRRKRSCVQTKKSASRVLLPSAGAVRSQGLVVYAVMRSILGETVRICANFLNSLLFLMIEFYRLHTWLRSRSSKFCAVSCSPHSSMELRGSQLVGLLTATLSKQLKALRSGLS